MIEIRARHTKRRRQRAKHRHENRHPACEQQDGPIQGHDVGNGHAWWPQRCQELQRPSSKRQADGRGGEREQRRLDQQLSHDGHPAGAEGRAYGDLLLSIDRPRHEEIPDIHARDQQHHTD